MNLKKDSILKRKVSRRYALSTAAKIGISAVVAGVAGGIIGYAIKPTAPPVTTTVTKTATVTAPATTTTVTKVVTKTVTAPATTIKRVAISDIWGPGPWDSINWDKPLSWPERLRRVKIGKIPDHWIDKFSFLETYRPDKIAAIGGYVLPEGWKEAIKGVDKLRFLNYGGMPHDPATAMGFAAFEDLTGITIEYEEMEELTLWEKTVSILTAKSPEIDILDLTAVYYTSIVAKRHWAMPLDFFWPEDVLALYSPAVKDIGMYNGHWWSGAYISTKPFMPFIRKSWLKEATGSTRLPKTWKELVSVLRKITKWAKENLGEGYYGWAVPGKDYRYMWRICTVPFFSLGGELVTPDGKINVTSKEWRMVNKMLVDLFKEGVIPKEALGWSWTEAPEVFGRGKAGFVLAGTVQAVRFSNPKLSPGIQDDWLPMEPLSWDVGYPKATCEESSQALMISPFISDEKKAAVLLFLDLYRSNQAQWNEVAYEGNETLNVPLYERPDVMERLVAGRERRMAVQYSRAVMYPPIIDMAMKIWHEWFQRAALGEVSVDEALENAQEEINKL